MIAALRSLKAAVARFGSGRMARVRRALLPMTLACVGAAAFAQNKPDALNATAQRYPAGSIRSTADADAAVEAVRKERKEVESRYAAGEKACNERFFASKCIEEEQERRYQEMAQLRKVEVEANAFRRQARVAQRDKALAEHLAKEENKRRQQAAAQQGLQAPAETGGAEVAEPVRKHAPIFTDRAARHEEKMKRIREEEAAGAQDRAENAAAYEKKVQDAELHRQKVAERKAEKERKRRMTEDAKAVQPSEQAPPGQAK